MKAYWCYASVAAATLLAGCGQDTADAPTATADIGAYTRSLERTASTSALAQAASTGCQSRSARYPWSRAELRTWTPLSTTQADHPYQSLGTAYGEPFSARLVQAYGSDYGDARRTVILEMSDGCRRQFRTESFSDADNAVIDAEMAKWPLPADPASYRLTYRSGLTSASLVRGGSLAVHTTQHFAIWYGRKTSGDFYRTIAEEGRTMEQAVTQTGEWLERLWAINRSVLGAPMPFATGTNRAKLDVYLCGTGRPNVEGGDLEECGASAAEVMNVSAWAVAKGSIVLTHEFGHMIQFYSGGFRDKGDAGPIWETGAEWNAFAVSPAFDASGAEYLNQLENGFLFSGARYGATPIMTYLFEKDATRSLVFGTWLRNLRNAAGATQEDYLPAFVRLAKDAGIYPDGFASFADDAGWYGARLVAMDFLNQRAMLDQSRESATTTWLPHLYTPLARVATTTDPTVFAPPAQRPLLEWGTHIVPLTATGSQVKVTLTGGTTANQAAWRFTLVTVDANDTPTYAPLTAVVGKGSATVALSPAAGTKLYLAVTATPYVYETLGWQENGKTIRGTRFPYRVKIEGATPRTGAVVPCDPTSAEDSYTRNFTLNGNSDAPRRCE